MRSRGEVSPGSRHAVVAGVAVAVALVALALLFALGLWLWGPIGSAADSSEEPGAGSGGDAVATSAPVFATDEEALAAATEAYARYLAVSGTITSETGQSSERIADFVSNDFLTESMDDFAWFSNSQVRSVGAVTFKQATLQSYTQTGGSVTVVLYLCQDVSGVRLFDVSGLDVTPADRADVLPLEVELESGRAAPTVLVVSRANVWAGEPFCGA
jgi:hypothetical protein